MAKSKGFNPIPKTSTSPGQDAGMSGPFNPLARTPYDAGGSPKAGDYKKIPSTPYDQGSSVYGGESYAGLGKTSYGPVADGPRNNDCKEMPGTSTSPGQSAGEGGEYYPVGEGLEIGWEKQEVHSTDGGMEKQGYKVLGTHNVLDQEIPNDHSWGEEDCNYQGNYFEYPDYCDDPDD